MRLVLTQRWSKTHLGLLFSTSSRMAIYGAAADEDSAILIASERSILDFFNRHVLRRASRSSRTVLRLES